MWTVVRAVLGGEGGVCWLEQSAAPHPPTDWGAPRRHSILSAACARRPSARGLAALARSTRSALLTHSPRPSGARAQHRATLPPYACVCERERESQRVK